MNSKLSSLRAVDILKGFLSIKIDPSHEDGNKTKMKKVKSHHHHHQHDSHRKYNARRWWRENEAIRIRAQAIRLMYWILNSVSKTTGYYFINRRKKKYDTDTRKDKKKFILIQRQHLKPFALRLRIHPVLCCAALRFLLPNATYHVYLFMYLSEAIYYTTTLQHQLM